MSEIEKRLPTKSEEELLSHIGVRLRSKLDYKLKTGNHPIIIGRGKEKEETTELALLNLIKNYLLGKLEAQALQQKSQPLRKRNSIIDFFVLENQEYKDGPKTVSKVYTLLRLSGLGKFIVEIKKELEEKSTGKFGKGFEDFEERIWKAFQYFDESLRKERAVDNVNKNIDFTNGQASLNF